MATGSTFPWPQYYVLSFDPGTRDLGVALVAYGAEGSDPLNDEEYYIRYGAVWDVIHNKKGTLQENLEALHGVLTTEPALQVVLQHPEKVDVIIENQEGCDFSNASLTASLMRMCGIASALWMFFAARGHHVEIVGKKSKWGWASFKGAPRYKLQNEGRRREMRKKYFTYYVMDLMRRQYDRVISFVPVHFAGADPEDGAYRTVMNGCLVTRKMMENFALLRMDEKAHICDCIVAGMFYGRKRFRKTSKNVFRPDIWERMLDALISGGRRGITMAVLDTRNKHPGGLKRPRPTDTGLLPTALLAAPKAPGASTTPAAKGTRGAPARPAKRARAAPAPGRDPRDGARVKLSRYLSVNAAEVPLGMTVPH